MKPTCIIVIGPECSGTRLATRLCIAAGCFGDATPESKAEHDGWPQRYDIRTPGNENPVVLRRTLPYHPNRCWPDLAELSRRIESWGRDIKVVVTLRDMGYAVASQLAKTYIANSDQGNAEWKRAYDDIRRWLDFQEYDMTVFDYAAVVARPLSTVNTLMRKVGLPQFENLPEVIYDGNAKYR
jgi:hypothetical protein